jgi:hypothetical protein
MTSATLKVYTAVVAVVCAAAIAWSINQSAAAASWRSEVSRWQTVAQSTVVHDRHTVRRYRALARRYNALVVSTRQSQRRLLSNLQPVQVPTAPVPAPAAPIATASAPATHTS